MAAPLNQPKSALCTKKCIRLKFPVEELAKLIDWTNQEATRKQRMLHSSSMAAKLPRWTHLYNLFKMATNSSSRKRDVTGHQPGGVKWLKWGDKARVEQVGAKWMDSRRLPIKVGEKWHQNGSGGFRLKKPGGTTEGSAILIQDGHGP